jgi:hypothetical protein
MDLPASNVTAAIQAAYGAAVAAAIQKVYPVRV